MARPVVSRLLLRPARLLVPRRAASTTSEAASAASQGAAAASKASEGLSRVTSSAGPALSKLAASATRAVSSMGGRTGRVVSYLQGLTPHVVYYGKVAGELGQMVYKGRGMQPPSVQTVQSYLAPVTNAIRNPSTAARLGQKTALGEPQSFLTRLRNLDSATLTQVGIVGAETIGFFSIGEIIGRFKLVGYRSSAPAHHGH